jgi:hypothetical protein
MEQADAIKSWVVASVAEELFASRKEAMSELLKAQLLNEFANQLYAKCSQPVNPKLQVEKDGRLDHQATYTVQARFKFSARTSDELLAMLKAALGSEEGQRLFDNEIDTTPLTTLRSLNELMIGHYEGQDFVPATQQEQAVAEKLIAFIDGQNATPLTDEERELALVLQDQMKMKPGFFDRVAGYCKSVADLKALFRVITPLDFLSHAKFGISDTSQQRHHRLMAAVADILGEAEEEKRSRSDKGLSELRRRMKQKDADP